MSKGRVFRPRSSVLRTIGLKAGSLGSISRSSDKVDMSQAKAIVRENRRIRAGGISQDEIRRIETKQRRRLEAWWRYRRYWVSWNVDGRRGKQKPGSRWIEFPNGDYVSIE